MSVQTFTSNETKSSSQSSEGGKRYKKRQHRDISVEEQCVQSEEQGEQRFQVDNDHDDKILPKITNEGTGRGDCSYVNVFQKDHVIDDNFFSSNTFFFFL